MSGTRYTRKDAERAFERLAYAKARRLARNYATDDPGREGTWLLDYNPTYGGCVIREIVPTNPAGGFSAETEPFGSRRRSPREFCEAVDFALRVLDA